MKIAVVDVDDLWQEEQLAPLIALREAIPDFRVTCYSIPNFLGPVAQLRDKYPWITFAIHGFEHTFAECRSWTTDLAKARIERALEMEYTPIFKPPQWTCDAETEIACQELGVLFHHHADYTPTVSGLKTYSDAERPGRPFRALHTHLQRNPATDWIARHPYFTPSYMKHFDAFGSPQDWAIVLP